MRMLFFGLDHVKKRSSKNLLVVRSLLEKWATMTENICHPTPLMTEFPFVIVAHLTNL